MRAADLLPNDADAQLKAGALLLLAGRAEGAKASADKAIAVNPKNADARVPRANAMAGFRDVDGALDEMQQALRLDRRSSLQINLGAVQQARGNLPGAESAFRQAAATDSLFVQARGAASRAKNGEGPDFSGPLAPLGNAKRETPTGRPFVLGRQDPEARRPAASSSCRRQERPWCADTGNPA